VDNARFDALTRSLAVTDSRRTVVRRLIGGAAAGALALAGTRRAGAQVGPAVCVPNGARCGPADEGNQRRCADCCSDYTERQPNGQRRCACRPDGLECSRDDQCCDNVCEGGVCGEGFVCRPDNNVCRGGTGTCGGDPNCVCAGVGRAPNFELVCADVRFAVCQACRSDADCRRAGFPSSATCVRNFRCCGGGSECLVPCGTADLALGVAPARHAWTGR
jgi:hypothetical protein